MSTVILARNCPPLDLAFLVFPEMEDIHSVPSCAYKKSPEEVRNSHHTLDSDTLSLQGTLTTVKKARWLLGKGPHLQDQVGTNSQKLPQAIVILQMRERWSLLPEGRGWSLLPRG